MFPEAAEIYMERCLSLAEKGRGKTRTNPMVGAVLVYNGKIIGEGWHKAYGGGHAEVEAIRSCWAPEKIPEATLYVSLEPCNHHGKTPPCSSLILEHQIKKIVVGSLDPNPQVAGKGVQRLKSAGCEVWIHVLEQKCLSLNRAFMSFHKRHRPYIHLKWAQTSDGFMAPAHSDSYWISDRLSKQWVHQIRGEYQAILIGIQTLINDRPRLNVRHWTGTSPQICVIDPQGKCLKNPELIKTLNCPWIFSQSEEEEKPTEDMTLFPWKGLKALLDQLYLNNIQNLLVEGGAKTLSFFIENQLWDEATVFESSQQFLEGLQAPKIPHIEPAIDHFASDQVIRYWNKSESNS
ncbi:MAG: bifunctional diaminohydroxyphosphoribosylaminopyrimidine deaminase/5-amino-6-(5-phosphoribosylamino)uracil reductase RibD [Flavobacteriaceae bacterium]